MKPALRRTATPWLGAALLGGWLLCGAPGGPEASADPAQTTVPDRILPPGLEKHAEDLLGAVGRSGRLPPGWRLTGISIRPYSIRYPFERTGQRFTLVLTAPSAFARHRSRNFTIALTAPSADLPPAERRALLRRLASLVQRHDRGPSPWKIAGPADPQPDHARPPSSWLPHPTRLLQGLLLLVLLGVGIRARWLVNKIRAVGWVDGALLAGCSLLGLGLRLLGGPRIPAWTNNHGYELLYEVLMKPLPGADPHGDTYNALHGLMLTVLPLREGSILFSQMVMSVAAIPLMYLVCRAWLKDRAWALCAALLAAVLPAFVYFATSEVRAVAGVFFLLLSLAALGWCIRDPHPVPRFVAALLAVLTTQVYPILMVVPLVLGLFVLTAPRGRQLLRQRWTWVAAAAGLALYSVGAIAILTKLTTGSGVHGPDYLRSLGLWRFAFLPRGSLVTIPGNIFLNSSITPPLFWGLGLIALVIAALDRTRRWALSAIAASALLLTLTALVGGRMNTARIQLTALPFYCLLCGVGLGVLASRLAQGLGRLTDRFVRIATPQRRRATLAAAIALTFAGLSVLLWPGPITRRSTPHRQHQLIAQGLRQIPRRCIIVYPSDGSTPIGRPPIYLKDPHGHRRQWRPRVRIDVKEQLALGTCLVYFRPADCYDSSHTPNTPVDKAGLVLACSSVEKPLVLRPLLTRALPAVPDNEQSYTRRKLRVGWFRIQGTRSKATHGRPGPQEKRP